MRASILVVDDEEDVRGYLSSLLEDNGYAVETAEDGNQAWRLIEAQPPDLILLDLMMPEQTGTGLYRMLHDHKTVRDIPVIVISGLAGRNVAVGKTVPVFDKPIDEDGLLKKIDEMVG
ncbi:MAG: response regulator [Thermoanaerobaculales bacterium]|nr:response regulator [Thermoanaerobaculales bacterium]